MPIKSYNRPVKYPTVSTPINVGFAGSLQAKSPNFFTIFTHKQNFLHHDIVVIGDETFQWVDPIVSNKVTNDNYIAVLKKHTVVAGNEFETLMWALDRRTSTQETGLIGFAPTLLDDVTLAQTKTAHSYVVQNIVYDAQNLIQQIPRVRELVFVDIDGTDDILPTIHETLVIGSDIYEVLDSSSGTPSQRTLSNNAYIPWDIADGVNEMLTDLATAINGTRVAYAHAGFLKVGGLLAAPLANGTANVLAVVNTAYRTTGCSLTIHDANAPGGAICFTSTALTITFPNSVLPLISINTFGGTSLLPWTVSQPAYLLIVMNGQGTLGPAELAGGDQILQSGKLNLPTALVNNNNVLFTQPFERDMAAISRLEDSGETLTFYIEADADERPNHDDVQHLFRIEFEPALSISGSLTLQTVVTPIRGTGVDSPAPYPTAIDVPHEENMDTWQTEAGRPRQDIVEIVNGPDDDLLMFGNVLGGSK